MECTVYRHLDDVHRGQTPPYGRRSLVYEARLEPLLLFYPSVKSALSLHSMNAVFTTMVKEMQMTSFLWHT